MATKPTLFAGLALPLSELSSDTFQSFVHEALVTIAPSLGLDIQGMAGAGGDDGFDSWARRTSDQTVACFQSKRLKKALNIGDVGHELAKVALTSWLGDSHVREHFFVAAGSIAKTVARAVRAKSKKELRDAALKQATNNELAALVESVSKRGGNAIQIVAAYVDGLDRVQAWSGQEFNARLSPVWSSLQDAIERTFAVHTVLRERPRPDFDEARYLEAIAASVPSTVSLIIASASPPASLRLRSAAAPSAPSTAAQGTKLVGHLVERLLEVRPGECAVLIGAGGAGKTTTLERLAAAACRRRMSDASAPIPVVLPLKEYKADLRELLHSRLGITYGDWQSLPGPFLFLLDGLNEVTSAIANSVASDLARIIEQAKQTSCMLALRADLSHPVVWPIPIECYRLVGLGPAQIQELAEIALPSESIASLMQEVLKHATNRSASRLFSLPFVVRYAAEVFREEKRLPGSLGEILERVLKHRFERNQEIETHHEASPVPYTTLQYVSSAVAFHMRVTLGRAAITRDELEALLLRIKSEGHEVFGLGGLSDTELLNVLLRHEHLTASRDTFSFQHDLFAGFLAARKLAKEWPAHLGTLKTHSADDAWRFVGRFLDESEALELIKTVAPHDPYLAAQVASEVGTEARVVTAFLDLEGTWLTSDLRAWIWMLSLATLGGDASRAALHRILAAAPGSMRRGQATRALAMTGDPAILREVHARADHETHPGTSGGDIAIWEDDVAPLAALSLARSKLAAAQPRTRIGASLRTIARYGTVEDAPLLEHALRTTIAPSAFSYAAQALRKHAPQTAHRVLNELLAQADVFQRVRIFEMLANDDQPIDTGWLVNLALLDKKRLIAEYGVDEANAIALLERATAALESAILTVDDKAAIVRAITDSTSHAAAWTLAEDHDLDAVDELALRAAVVAASGGQTVGIGYACRFARRRMFSDDLRNSFIEAVRAYLRNESELLEWDTVDALEYLAHEGLHAEAIPVVARLFERWVGAMEAVQRGATSGVTIKRGVFGPGPLDEMDLELLFTRYRDLFPSYTETLPWQLRVKLLRFPTFDSASHEAQSKLLRGIPNDVLDQELLALDSVEKRRSAMRKLAPYGPTPGRADALREAIQEARHLKAVLSAAQLMWDERVARAAVAGVRAIDWSHEFAYITVDDLIRNAPPFDRDLVGRILDPVLNEELSKNSREILEAWRDIGRRRDPPPS